MDNEKIAHDARANEAGYKRPQWWLDGKLAPVPWVGGQFPSQNQWKRVQTDRAFAVEDHQLCLMCGEGFVEGEWQHRVYALVQGFFASDFVHPTPSPTFGHPSCILKAVTFCPHLKFYEEKYDVAASTAEGTSITKTELKELAKQEHERLAKLKERG